MYSLGTNQGNAMHFCSSSITGDETRIFYTAGKKRMFGAVREETYYVLAAYQNQKASLFRLQNPNALELDGWRYGYIADARNLNCIGDSLYFTLGDALLRMNLKPYWLRVIAREPIRHLLATKQALYYKDKDKHLITMTRSGEHRQDISKRPVKCFDLNGDELFYDDSSSLYAYNIRTGQETRVPTTGVMCHGFALYGDRVFFHAPPHQDWYSVRGPKQEGHWGDYRPGSPELMGILIHDNKMICFALNDGGTVYEADLDTNEMKKLPFRADFRDVQYFGGYYLVGNGSGSYFNRQLYGPDWKEIELPDDTEDEIAVEVFA